jgi:hypothetical protein
MKEIVKEVQKKTGEKLFENLSNLFGTKKEFHKFCKRHKNATKEYFEARLTRPKKSAKAEEKEAAPPAGAPAAAPKAEAKAEAQPKAAAKAPEVKAEEKKE